MTPSREAGFTLVELLVAIALASIIAGVLGEAVAIGLKTTTATATTFADASNTRALTSHLLIDVQGAELIGTSAPPASICATAPADTVLWTRSPDPGGTVALYGVTRTPADAAARTAAFSQLVREPCGGQPVTLAAWPGDTDSPTIACDGRPQCGGETPLLASLTAAATQFDLAGDATSAFPNPNATGSPVPYEITVGNEAMSVTKLEPTTPPATPPTSTLTVSRPSGVSHAAGEIVAYTPASVSIRVPRAASAVCAHTPCDASDDFNLTIATGSS